MVDGEVDITGVGFKLHLAIRFDSERVVCVLVLLDVKSHVGIVGLLLAQELEEVGLLVGFLFLGQGGATVGHFCWLVRWVVV